MFTGIIQQVGKIAGRRIQGDAGKLLIETAMPLPDPCHGESIAINGTCLTLESWNGNTLEFHVMAETFHRTNLGILPVGTSVNMERAMMAGERFGGHIVTGHVDGTGKILAVRKIGSDTEYTVELPETVSPFFAPKGSVSLDGISLTLASLDADRFTVRIIPVTWNETALRTRKPGDIVNIEADLIGKYVYHQLENVFRKEENGKKELTMNDLMEAGF